MRFHGKILILKLLVKPLPLDIHANLATASQEKTSKVFTDPALFDRPFTEAPSIRCTGGSAHLLENL